MKCSECEKELCIYGGCHNKDCEAYEEDNVCVYGDEWCEEEDEWQDPLEHVCQGCGSDLCICGKCHVAACEEECFECFVFD